MSEADLNKSPRGASVQKNYFNDRGWRILDALDKVGRTLDEHQRILHNFDHPSAVEEGLMVEHVGLLKAGQYQGREVEVKGWFRRAPMPFVEIKQIRLGAKTSTSLIYPLKLVRDRQARCADAADPDRPGDYLPP